MPRLSAPGGLQTTTSYKVVLPFYTYGTFALLVAVGLLLGHTNIAKAHHFHPVTLSITHLMALGWGTMIILGASHQLLPVLIKGKLASNFLAYLSFGFMGIGIPFLVWGFYHFQFDWKIQLGAVLINIGVLSYVINVFKSIFESDGREVHAWFMATAAIWLFSTTFLGLLLVFNFTRSWLPSHSLAYLTLHAHMGIVGWFLLMVTGVGSRLIPMFLISKYSNKKLLWWIFSLINIGLISFIVFRSFHTASTAYYISIILTLIGIVIFGYYCFKARKTRIRKNVDYQMKLSLLSILQMLLPILALIVVLLLLPSQTHENLVLLYGFCIFFGWITAIIFGMTFKTLPFIVWNKVYSDMAHGVKLPAPKDLFNDKVFRVMLYLYPIAFVIFGLGIILKNDFLLKTGATALLLAALLYIYNSLITIFHKAKI